MIKRVLGLFMLLAFASCTNREGPEAPLMETSTWIAPTDTGLPPTTPATLPSVTPSVTPTIMPPCDPFQVTFCITAGHFILQRPIQPPGNNLIDPTYGYGSTASGTRDPHHGVEFANASGTPVYAAADGTVIFAGPDEEAIYAPWGNFYGNLVVIEHPDGIFTLYAHLSKINVANNQNVRAGDQIGEVGRTGGAIGSHLHFEVRLGDVEDYFSTQNPELWLAPANRETGALMISVLDEKENLVTRANFTVGYYSDPAQPPLQMFYATPYSSDLLGGEENAALSELPAGHYRIVVETHGQMLERWVEVESGRLTQVVFQVK